MFAELNTLVVASAVNLGAAFRSVIPLALIGAAVLMAVYLAVAFRRRSEAAARPPWNLWEKLVYLATILSVGVLGVTAFVAVIRFGTLGGWSLFVHMFGAGAFVAVLPLLAITWCQANRFGGDAPLDGRDTSAPRFFWLPKVMFWIILASGLAVTLTMLLSMLPLFGTDGLHNLLDIHRYSGLVVVVAMIFHVYGVLLQRFGLR